MANPTSQLTPQDIWQDVLRVRESSPLVHSITNFVVMNLNANVLLSLGASPVMAHAQEEVVDMVAIAQALVLNIGTLEPYWIDSMCLALQAAAKKGIPTVLDPVGAGATPYRNAAITKLMGFAAPTIIRGNGSEIMSTAGAAVTTRGVDSAAASDSALGAAQALLAQTHGVVCVSGEVDHILDANRRWARLSNGHVWMTKITGVGCSASAMLGAFAVAQPDPWRATVSSMAYLGVAGQLAAERAIGLRQGVGSMQAHMLDILQLMDENTFIQTLRMEQAVW